MKALPIAAAAFLAFAAPVAAAPNIAASGETLDDVTGAIARETAADALPSFDLARNCAGAFASSEAVGACIGREQTSRGVITQQWPTLSPRVRKLCAARIPEGGARAYTSLADCALKESRLEKFRTIQSAR